jgi:hypothetical protein
VGLSNSFAFASHKLAVFIEVCRCFYQSLKAIAGIMLQIIPRLLPSKSLPMKYSLCKIWGPHSGNYDIAPCSPD